MHFQDARTPVLLGLVGAVVGFLGSWVPSYWGDEAASVMSATRSWPSLVRELSQIDAVHGLYYAFLHVWVSVFGTSELATRLPSALAAGVMVAGTVVLVRLFGDTRLAVIAGIVAIVLPRTTSVAIEARSYAMGAATAVWLTVLLITLVRRRASTRWWAVYGVAMGASVYLFLHLGLLLVVHAAYLVFAHRNVIGNWVRGAMIAALVAAPMVLVGYAQREQIDFLARRNYATFANVVTKQWFGNIPVALLCWGLIAVAVAWMLWRRSETPLTLLALAWLVIPTAALLLGNATLSPMYNVRYLTFSTPAAAILVAAGINALSRLPGRAWTRTLVSVTLIGVLVALCAPVYLAQRTPWSKDGGSDWRQVAEFVGANAAPGDVVVFDQSTKPSRDPRLAMRLYPESFAGLNDISLVTPFDRTSGLWDTVAPLDATTLALGDSARVWAIELSPRSKVPADISHLEKLGYHLDSTTLLHRTTVYQLTKE